MQGLNTSDERSLEDLPELHRGLQVGSNMIFMFLTVIGNVLVCAAYYLYENLQTPSNIVVVSMACCDLLMVLTFVLKIASAFSEPNTRFYQCMVSSSWGFVVTSLIILHLCAISIDRLMAVKYSLRYNSIVTRTRVRIAVIGIWLFGAIEASVIPLIFTSASTDFLLAIERSIDPCLTKWTSKVATDNWGIHTPGFKATSICIIIVLFALPILVMVLSYSYVWKQARKHSKQISKQRRAFTETTERHFKTHVKSTKTFAIVVGVYGVCFLPLFIAMCQKTFSYSGVGYIEGLFVVLLAESSVIWNPIIYAGRNKEFKIAFRKLNRFSCVEVQTVNSTRHIHF